MEIVRVPLYRGGNRWVRGELVGHALLDAEDAHLAELAWQLNGSGYAARTVKQAGGVCETKLMHRVVLGLPRGDQRQGDHINGDRLDNRRSNLRIVFADVQAQNRRSHRGSVSRFRGVARDHNRWRAYITVRGRRHHLGGFATEEEAAQVAATARSQLMPWSVS